MERKKEENVFVVDGSEIEEMVGNEKVFSSYVDHKFQELDVDGDGKLSIQELQPAIADIGAALGLPPHGSSPDSDQIYSHVRSYFTCGREEEEVSKNGFKGVLSDVLLGVAVGLNRHPIEILKLDGKLLRDYVESSGFEVDAVNAYSLMEMETNRLSLDQCLRIGLGKLTVDLGMPPSSDSSVIINITGPAMDCVEAGCQPMKRSMQQTFVDEFRKVVVNIAGRLEQHPVIVAHSEKTFDGSSVRHLLSDQTEFDRLLEIAWRNLPKDRHQKVCKEYISTALDEIAPSAGLPPYGAVEQVDVVMNEAYRMVVNANKQHGKSVDKEEFKKIIAEIHGIIMLKFMGNHVHISINTVVQEPPPPLASTLLVNPGL